MTPPPQAPRPIPPSLAPVGRLGFRGRQASPEERGRILDAFFFEGPRRVPYLQQFFALMVLSASIAGFGLANDSGAVVIGAMLVAPLMTPILAIAAASVEGWGQRAVDSLLIVGAGALVAIGVGFLIGFIFPSLRDGLPLPGELVARTGPNILDLCIALAAGAAAGFVAVRTEASGALPGVGIAVALVPPLTALGMVIGIGKWDLAFGAALLFGTNLVAIVFAASAVLFGAGFAAHQDVLGARFSTTASRVVLLGLAVVAIPLAAHSWTRLEDSRMRLEAVNDARAWAAGLSVRDVELDRSVDPALVTVTVTGTQEPPDPSLLADAIAQDLEKPVRAEVIFVPIREGLAPPP